MNRSINDIEYEIVNQILISEVCFDVCKIIPKIPGRGSDFLPFYHNLNFSKGVISLHSLLLSNLSDELSIKNYLKQYRLESPNVDINNFEAKIDSISESFKNIFPLFLRHKIVAHTDQGFDHTDFTNAYIAPDVVEKYILLIQSLKKDFFKFSNRQQDDYPHQKILEQSQFFIRILTDH